MTGSIGVIFLRPKVHGLMDKIGLAVEVIKFGQNKDMGSPFRDSTEEESRIMQKVVNDFGERFIHLVQKHRQPEPQALLEISTARVFTAQEALRLKLVDRIGYLSDTVREAKTLAGLPENARVVVYHRTEYPDDNFYNIGGAAGVDGQMPLINIALPESLNLPAGFYYLWPGAIAAE